MTLQQKDLNMKVPIAVLGSDIHYNRNTLELADASVKQMIDKANELQVQLIICGDMHDSKADLRAECVSAMLSTLKKADIEPIVLIGNHDRVNEKSSKHSLEFLNDYCSIIDLPTAWYCSMYVELIPYQHDTEALKRHISSLPKNSRIIMHQGVMGSEAGHYIQDKSALSKQDLASHTVYSGHYHKRQTMVLPEDGKFTYVGNPYTMNYGESNDPEKGFLILYSDFTHDFVPTNLRKHRVVDTAVQNIHHILGLNNNDLNWIKLRGTSEQLNKVNRQIIQEALGITNFKLDLISEELSVTIENDGYMSDNELLDKIIENYRISSDQKDRLKQLWKKFYEKT